MAVDIEALVEAVDAELRAGGGTERAEKEKAYLKSDLRHYGTPVPAIRVVARSTTRQHPGLTHDELITLVEILWNVPVHERRKAAVELLRLCRDQLDPHDVALLERLLREARTWALVDDLAIFVVGRLVERHPEMGALIDRWATDDDLWLRRSALLALLVPLREGGGDFDRFARNADAMLDEREFFIRKAIGWVLRDTGGKRPDLVYEWILPRRERASGVTVREAVKPLSPAQRATIENGR